VSGVFELDHVGIAVDDLETEVERYRSAFGIEPSHRETVESQGVEEVLFPAGDSFVQLLGPLGPETPVGRFLSTRGPGLHHVGYRVEDLDQLLEKLAAQGIRLVDERPRAGSRGTRIAFVHPRSMGGVLVELVEPPKKP
jgi:methylmalonyl-CoA/ethylmalonyl-CoA epimerase